MKLFTDSAYVSAKALNCLRQAAGGVVTYEQLGCHVYGNAPWSRPQLWLLVSRLRARGFPIETRWNEGVRLASRVRIVAAERAPDPAATLRDLAA